MLKSLCLATLGELDQGTARAICDAAIRTAVNDLIDRGEDGKAREVIIKLSMQKMDNSLAVMHVEATPKLPCRRTGGTIAREGADRGGEQSLIFQEYCAKDPNQGSLEDFANTGSVFGAAPPAPAAPLPPTP